MKKSYLLAFLLFCTGLLYGGSARACYATFTHTNACAGDTVWVFAGDLYATQFWDFGDSAAGPNVAYDDTAFHIYNTPGTYYITHFVNIGAEWAFETQAITITADCFMAAFTAKCNGANNFNFTNQSTGSNLTYAWDFGDPASAPNNTSTLMNPFHTFTGPGNYLVTLIITDGINSDTTTQTVVVDATCMSVTYSYMLNTCVGDTTFFNPYYTNVTSVSWDFGDPASGPDNYSSNMTPYHIYTSTGLYVVTLIYSDGVNYDTLVLTAYITNCNVFPADCNRDGWVSPEDLFAIGIYYGDTGSVRPAASLNFTEQPAPNWNNNTPFLNMYLQDMVNKKHADCNGDGVINAADVTALTQNFGMTHAPHGNITSSMQLLRPTDPPFKLQAPPQVSHGPVIADLSLGSSTVPCPYVYGYAVSIPYDPAMVDAGSITVDFTGSWLDSPAQANLINWYYNDLTSHTLHIASVRKDHMGVTGGFGNIAHVHFNILPLAPSGTLALNILPTAKLISNAVNNVASGQVLRYLKANIINASSQVLGVNNLVKPDLITVSPIPANRSMRISLATGEKISGISLINLAGQRIRSYATSTGDIDVSMVPNGIYWLKVTTATRNYEKKIEVLH